MAGADFHAQAARLAGLYDNIRPAAAAGSKPVILVKGRVLPPMVHRITYSDVLLWDWILDERELGQAIACVLLPEEMASPSELAFLRRTGIPVLARSREQAPGCRFVPYEDEAELITRIAQL